MSTEPQVTPTSSEPRGWTWRKTMWLGVLGIYLTMVIIALTSGGFDIFMAIIGVPILIGAILLKFLPRAGALVLGIISLALLGMNSPFLVPALRFTETGIEWATIVLMILSQLLIIVAAIPAFLEARRTAPASGGPRAVTVMFLLVAVAASAFGAYQSSQFEDAEQVDGDVALVLEDFEFRPAQLEAEGNTVAVFIDNQDGSFHTFTIDKLGVDVVIPAGRSARVQFEADEGTYDFYCKPHAPDMAGKLEVNS